MKINSINVNFGKRLIANCSVKNINKERHSASIYEYDPWNKEDIKEIENSASTGAIGYDFYRAGLWHNRSASRFYAIKDNETGEITASSELTHRISKCGDIIGNYIQINEMQGNRKYIDSLTPMMSFISSLGQFYSADSIISSYETIDYSELKDYKFDELQQGIFVLPKRRFEENIAKGELRNQIDYNV